MCAMDGLEVVARVAWAGPPLRFQQEGQPQEQEWALHRPSVEAPPQRAERRCPMARRIRQPDGGRGACDLRAPGVADSHRSVPMLRPSDHCTRRSVTPTWGSHGHAPNASLNPSTALRRPVCSRSQPRRSPSASLLSGRWDRASALPVSPDTPTNPPTQAGPDVRQPAPAHRPALLLALRA